MWLGVLEKPPQFSESVQPVTVFAVLDGRVLGMERVTVVKVFRLFPDQATVRMNSELTGSAQSLGSDTAAAVRVVAAVSLRSGAAVTTAGKRAVNRAARILVWLCL
jgi:hypothetical protein